MTDKTVTQWIEEIDKSIEDKKKKNIHSYFQFSMEISDGDSKMIAKYFSDKKYVVEFRKCPRMKYDLIISGF